MATERTIDLSLFELLDAVASLLKIDTSEEDENTARQKAVLRLHKIEDCIETFIESFLLQFFTYGYGLEIDGLNSSSLEEIEKYFKVRKLFSEYPEAMIQVFKEAIEIKEDLEVAVYLTPPKEGDIIRAYKKFIPRMLKCFKKEGRKIENFLKVVAEIDRIFKQIGYEEDSAPKQAEL